MSESDVEYAGFWIRVGATMIDSLLIMVITFPLLISYIRMELLWLRKDDCRACGLSNFVGTSVCCGRLVLDAKASHPKKSGFVTMRVGR